MIQNMIVTLCSTEPCEEALKAYSPLVADYSNSKKGEIGMAVMDFSRIMGKDAEKKNIASLRKIKELIGVPVYFFGQEQLERLVGLVSDKIPGEIKDLMLTKRLDYGWMRNKGFLLAMAAGFKTTQFFDIDTVPMAQYPRILKIHSAILKRPFSAVVSGTYCGPRQVTTSMFKSEEGEMDFLKLIKEMTSFDVLNPPPLGGALAVKLEFVKMLPLPLLPATTMSDDFIFSFLAKLVGWETTRTGELVEHRHGGKLDPESRQGKEWIEGYFIRLMRTGALMSILNMPEIINRVKARREGNDIYVPLDDTINKLNKFLAGLAEIAESEDNKTIRQIIKDLREKWQVSSVAEEIREGVRNYLTFLVSWPEIAKAAEKLGPEWVEIH